MKRLLSCLLALLMLFAAFPVRAYEMAGVDVKAAYAMLASLDTGEILYEKEADTRLYPASITKLMTAAVILDHFPDPSQINVTLSKEAYTRILGTGSSVLNAKVGETLNGKDALAAVLISSAGDIVYAWAETCCGSVEAFTEEMNQKAVALGMTQTHYENPIGLHHETQYTTVRDIYTLTTYLLKEYPLVAELCGKARYNLSPTNMSQGGLLVTTNMMIDPATVYYYPYATGLKTGFTDEAGRCLVSTASYNGYHYLCIAMNCPTTAGTRTEFTTSRDLFRYVFNNFQFKSVVDTTAPVTEVKVRLSSESDYVSLYADAQVRSILPNEADNSSVVVVPHLESDSVNAPVRRGDVLGTADVMYAEKVIGQVNLIAGNDVASSAWLVFWDAMRRFFASTPVKIIDLILLIALVITVLYTISLNRRGKEKKRVVKFVPYNEAKEVKRKEALKKRRKKQGRPEYGGDPDEPPRDETQATDKE